MDASNVWCCCESFSVEQNLLLVCAYKIDAFEFNRKLEFVIWRWGVYFDFWVFALNGEAFQRKLEGADYL